MRAGKFICLLVFLGLVFASAEVDMNQFVHKTSSILSEIDSIVNQAKFNPLASAGDRPVAPHITTPNVIEHESRQDYPQFPQLNSLAEASSTTKNFYVPDFSSPPVPDMIFDSKRVQFQYGNPTDIELRLRSLFPKPVSVDSSGPVPVDPLINAAEVLPKDPTADNMLQTFNVKYNVNDDDVLKTLTPIAQLDPKFIKKVDDERQYNDVQAEYRTVYQSANKGKFDSEIDTVQSLDKHLAALWSKRFEYMVAERNQAIQSQKLAAEPPSSFPVETDFIGQRNMNDPKGILQNINTFATQETEPIPTIPNRPDFVPEVSYYGPHVVTEGVNIESLPKQGPNFYTPNYSTPYASAPVSIVLKKAEPDMDLFGKQEPLYKEPVDYNRLVPAALSTDKPFTSKPPTDIVMTNNGFVDPAYKG